MFETHPNAGGVLTPAGQKFAQGTGVATLACGALVTVAYVAAASLGFRLSFVAEQVTTVWAPSGIAIAALLLAGPRLWPAVWLGALLANAATTAPLWTAPLIATGNTLEAVAAAWLLTRAGVVFDPRFRRLADVVALAGLAALICTVISATIGVATLCAAGVQPWDRFSILWLNWWLGDMLGTIIVAPAILTAATMTWSRGTLGATVASAAAGAAVSYVVFGQALNPGTQPLAFVLFPIVIAAAVAGGPMIAAQVVLATSAAAVAAGSAVFASMPAAQAHGSLVVLQVFMGVLGTTAMLLAAAVAERKTAEWTAREAARVLDEREQMLQLAQRAGGVALFEWDFANSTARCSAEFFRMLGLPAREGTIASADWAQFVHPDDRDRLAAHTARALSGAEPATADYRILTPDGETRWVTYTGKVERTATGERMLGAVLEITARKRAEAALQQEIADRTRLAQVAEEASRLKDEFLATLSHELRTPINAVLGWTQMVRRGNLHQATPDHALAVIERNAAAQARLIEDLLVVSRVVTGRLPIRAEAVNLGPVVEEAVETVATTVTAKGLSLRVDLSDRPVVVTGDSDRLHQVVWNLVANAIKFTPAGGRVEVELRGSDAAATIVVRDTGQGFDPLARAYVFEPFRQVDASRTREHGGLGLGLAIVRHLVEAHGGSVHANSEGPGRGATFTVMLPLRASGHQPS